MDRFSPLETYCYQGYGDGRGDADGGSYLDFAFEAGERRADSWEAYEYVLIGRLADHADESCHGVLESCESFSQPIPRKVARDTMAWRVSRPNKLGIGGDDFAEG